MTVLAGAHPDAPVISSTLSLQAVGFGLLQLAVASSGLAAYPTANKAFYVPFTLYRPYLVKLLWCMNGATASGNVDVGIYSLDGTRIVSSGSTAQSGTSTIQTFDITDTLIGPGFFYMAIALDGTTGTLGRAAPANAGVTRSLGVLEQTSAFALPSSATFALSTAVYIPHFGITNRTVI